MKQAQRQINYVMALWRRKWLILPLMVLGLGAALVLFSRVTPLYRAQATVALIPQSISKEIYPNQWQIGDRLKFIEREINSTSFLDALAEAQGVKEKDPEKLRRLTRTVAVRKVDYETFIFSSVHPDPKVAAEKTNLVAKIFVEQSQKRKIIEAEGSSDFLVDEIARLTKEIDKERELLADYQAKHKGELPSDREGHRREQAFLRQRMSELDARIETKERDVESREFLLEHPEEPMPQDNPVVAPPDPRLAQFKTLQSELAAAKLRYTERHPQVVRLQASLDALAEEIKNHPYSPSTTVETIVQGTTADGEPQDSLGNFVRVEILRLNEEIAEMSAERAKVNAEIQRLEKLVQASYERSNELGQISARIDLLEKKLYSNQNKLEILETEQEVFERGMDMRYELKNAAGVPMLPFHPDLLQFILFGLAGGGGLGAALALMLEIMDRSILTEADLEDLLDVELIAIIPNMDKEYSRSGPGKGANRRGHKMKEAAHG